MEKKEKEEEKQKENVRDVELVDDLEIMRNSFSKGVKASGGITPENLHSMLYAMSGRSDGKIDLDPMKIRIGESSLLKKLAGENGSESGY